MVDADLLLTFSNARAQTMFGMSAHDVGKPFRDLEISYRPVELRGLIDDVMDRRHPVEVRDVEWHRGEPMTPAFLDVSVVPSLSCGRQISRHQRHHRGRHAAASAAGRL